MQCRKPKNKSFPESLKVLSLGWVGFSPFPNFYGIGYSAL